MTTINIGIKQEDRQAIANELSILLANSYTLYLQTHNFHWNVKGPMFLQLHNMFEEHYTELAVAVDDIAERIRSLGFDAPGTYREFTQLSAIEETTEIPSAVDMVAILTKNHETLVKSCRKALSAAQNSDDESSAALISDRMRIHEKTAWMLRTQNA